jgi:hypothetical protein
VSVVIPARQPRQWLELSLAALAAQTYPSQLTEVLVVADDDGAVQVPDLAPERTRIIRAAASDRRVAIAAKGGPHAATGEVILRLAPGVLVCREFIEAQMRWHDVAGYLVVIPDVRPASRDGDDVSPSDVYELVMTGKADEFFDMAAADPGLDRAGSLADAAFDAYLDARGLAASWSVRLAALPDTMYADAPQLVDAELGYRLALAGAVFAEEGEARGWHLGAAQQRPSEVESALCEVKQRHRLPLRRDWRTDVGRHWEVPYVDVVVEAEGKPHPDVRATAAGALAIEVPGVVVTLVGPWSTLDTNATSDKADQAELRLTVEEFAHDCRVRFKESVPPTSAPAPFRFTCPAGAVPTRDSLRRLVEAADKDRLGILLLAFQRGPDFLTARLERTAAMARSMFLQSKGEDLTDVVSDLFGTFWIDGSEWALQPAGRTNVAASSSASTDAERWKKEAGRWKSEADRWRAEALIPWRARLVRGARRRASKIQILRKLAGKNG